MKNLAVWVGGGVILFFLVRRRVTNDTQPRGFMGLDPYMGGNWCGTMQPNYGNDDGGTFTDVTPTNNETAKTEEERSVWTKDEGSWLWGWGPK